MNLKKASLLVLGIAILMIAGCSDDDEVVAVYDPPPQPPQGVFTITGNDSVFIYWTAPYEGDIAEYGVYRSDFEFTGYERIALIDAVPNPNLDLHYYEPGYIDDGVSNGNTYYYAVTSIDKIGQESDLSAETVMDTPRPDGRMTLYDDAVDPTESAFDFSARTVVPSGDAGADVYLDRVGDVFYLNSVSDVDVLLQPMGFHASFDDVGWAPQEGWSFNGWAEIVEGHIYVVVIRDTHGDWNYAKLRVLQEDLTNGRVLFQWAYQTDINNPELAPPVIDESVTQAKPSAGSGM